MIIKEKRWLSKIVAMLCVLTMVVGVLTPASVGVAAATNITEFVIPIEDGIKYFDVYGDDMSTVANNQEYKSEGYIDEEGYYDTDKGYRYKYDIENRKISIKPKDKSVFDTSGRSSYLFEFYVESSSRLDVSSKYPDILSISQVTSSEGRNGFKIKLSGSASESSISLIISKQYTLTFSEGEGYEVSNIKGENVSVNDLSVTAKEGTEIKFDVKLLGDNNVGKEVSAVAYGVSLTGATKDNTTYSFTATVGSRNATVLISVVDKTFTIIEPEDTEGFTYVRNSDSTTVTYGGNFSFNVYPEEGYADPTVTINDDSHGTLKRNGNVYNITNITGDQTITINKGNTETYTIHFVSGTGYKVYKEGGAQEIEDQSVNITTGKNIKFQVKPNSGYEVSNITVNINGTTKILSATPNNEYTLPDITGDTIVTVNVSKIQYTITYDPDIDNTDAYILRKGASTAEYGSYTFWVTPKDGYETPTVKAGKDKQSASEVTPVSAGQYVITITENTVIVIEAKAKMQKNITLNAGLGFEFKSESGGEPEKTVEYGQDYKFKIELKEHYTKSKDNITVTANGVNIPAGEDGVYTIPKVTADQVVTVNGITKNTYNVTLTRGEGYTISTTEITNVTAEESFRFSVVANPGYEAITVDNIKATGGQQVETNGSAGDYIIKNLTADTVITVDDLKPVTYKATTNVSNATVTEDFGYNLNSIAHNGTLKFKVEADEYYQVTQVAVNGEPKTAVNEVYTVNNITNDIEITVTTRANVLTVNYIDEKYSKNSKTVEYSVEYRDEGYGSVVQESGEVTLYKPEDTNLYKFAGWSDKGEKAENVKVDTAKDTELTLTADWELNVDKIKENIKLTTSASWGGKEAGYTYTIKFTTAFESKLDEEYRDNIKVSGVGTLYSNTDIPSSDENKTSYTEKIIHRSGETAGELSKQVITDQTLFNYYKDYSDKDTTMLENGDYISLRLGSNRKDIERHGLGWVELTINGEKVVLFSSNEAKIDQNS